KIIKIIESYRDEYIEFHDFRSRRSGPTEYIDFHLVVSSHYNIETAHELCDRIEKNIKKQFNRAHILIHLEPEHEILLK
ncbi:cation transporter dimerization domain-containing protein, partial [Bacillus cereus]